MKTPRYFFKWADSLVRRWQTPEPMVRFDDESPPEGGEIPLIFNDNLAAGFFVGDVACCLARAYRIGIREQQKRHKQSAVRRWQRGRVKMNDEQFTRLLKMLEKAFGSLLWFNIAVVAWLILLTVLVLSK